MLDTSETIEEGLIVLETSINTHFRIFNIGLEVTARALGGLVVQGPGDTVSPTRQPNGQRVAQRHSSGQQ